MTKPLISVFDVTTGTDETREMTEEEYAALIESGWTETPAEEAPTE